MAVTRISWIDDTDTLVIGYNVYRDDLKINQSIIPTGTQMYEDGEAIKDTSHKYVVHSLSENSESVREVLNENLINFTAIEDVNIKTYQLIFEDDYTDGSTSVKNARGFNGASVAIVNGLLETWRDVGTGALYPNNPQGWVSGDIYRVYVTVDSWEDSPNDMSFSLRKTWGATKVKYFTIADADLPQEVYITFANQNISVSRGIAFFHQATNGKVARISNMKLYKLV